MIAGLVRVHLRADNSSWVYCFCIPARYARSFARYLADIEYGENIHIGVISRYAIYRCIIYQLFLPMYNRR